MLRAALTIAKKDIYSELRTKQVLGTMIIFAGLVILVLKLCF